MRRASQERCNLISRELVVLKAELSGDTTIDVPILDPSITDSETGKQAEAIVNGHPVADHAVDILRQQSFDVILSTPMLRVWARQGPEAEGRWLGSDLKGLRRNRLLLLLHMLTHPTAVVGTHNADGICQSDSISSQALAQTVRLLRSLLHQAKPNGPYIVNKKVLVDAGSQRRYVANGYTMNANRNYLVILKEF